MRPDQPASEVKPTARNAYQSKCTGASSLRYWTKHAHTAPCELAIDRHTRDGGGKYRMRPILIMLFSVLLTGNASSQDAQPKSIKTLKIQSASPEATALYAIESDGTVEIDWDTVETLASSKADRTMSPVAEVMLARQGMEADDEVRATGTAFENRSIQMLNNLSQSCLGSL